MASIKLGAVVVGIKGKVGGSVFSNARSGPTMSNINVGAGSNAKQLWGYVNGGSHGGWAPSWNGPWPTWPHLPYGNPYHRMALTSSLWKDLTSDEQLSWQSGRVNFPAHNKFGDVYTPSAFSLFVKFNSNRVIMNQAIIRFCPAPPVMPAYPEVHLFADPTGPVSVFCVTPVPEGSQMEILVTAGFTPSRQMGNGGYKLVQMGLNSDGNLIKIGDSCRWLFGLPLLGQRINMKWRLIDIASGVAGPWQYNKTVVAPPAVVTKSISVDPTHGPAERPYTLTWASTGAYVVVVKRGDRIISSDSNGTLECESVADEIYTIIATGSDGVEHTSTCTWTLDIS